MGNVGNVARRLGHMNNLSINLDISHRCTLECPKCLRSLYKFNNTKVPGHDMTIKEYLKIIQYFSHVNFCGNASDPVFNPNFIEFLKRNYNHNISCEVHNAATGKSLSWYLQAFESNPKAKWVFGIDGYPEESDIYRINQNGVALFESMKLCAKMGLDTTWRYIAFKYNEDHIDDCKRIALHYGIKFQLIQSSRFLKDDPYKPTKHYVERDYEQTLSKVY